MFRTLLVAAVSLLAATPLTARAAPKDEVEAAAQKLADAHSFAWSTKATGRNYTSETEGATEKGGYTLVSTTVATTAGKTSYPHANLGNQWAIKWADEWETFEEAAKRGSGRVGRMRAQVMTALRNEKPFAVVTRALVSDIKEFKKTGDAYEGELTEAGVKVLFTGSGLPVQMSGARGTMKLWVKDGVLSKVESHLRGSLTLNGREVEVDTTDVTDIKDVGTAKPRVPEEAKKKLIAAASTGEGAGPKSGSDQDPGKLPF